VVPGVPVAKRTGELEADLLDVRGNDDEGGDVGGGSGRGCGAGADACGDWYPDEHGQQDHNYNLYCTHREG
jgi:hypothetical protein